MKIVDIRVTDLQLSRTPDTLKKHLCTPTSKFRDALASNVSWFGPVALSLVEVLTDDGVTGVGSIGGFTSAGSEVIKTYLKPLAVVEPDTGNELFWKVFHGEPRAVCGYIAPSGASGLGVDINWEAAECLRR